MSDGPPIPFNPSSSDHLNFAPQTRKYRADRSIRALGMQGISTGGPGRPLYGLGKFTEDLIVAARGSHRTGGGIEKQVTNRPRVQTGEDGSAALVRENQPAKPLKQKESGTGWPGAASTPTMPTPPGFQINVRGGDWGPSVTA